MKSFKKTFVLFVISLVLVPNPGFSSDQFGSFQQLVDSGSLKPFTRDLGSLLGSASFHNGRSLGLSGFDLGMHGGVQLKPSAGDLVLRNRGVHAFGLPWVQAELGLPFRLDGYIRGISYQGITIAGGGLRYQITKPRDEAWTPHLLLATAAHSVVHSAFSASHFGANLVASVGVPKVTAFMGAGLDRTRLVVRAVPTLAPNLVGTSVNTLESRFTAGLSFRIHSFIYIDGAYTLTHGLSGFDSGLGLRF